MKSYLALIVSLLLSPFISIASDVTQIPDANTQEKSVSVLPYKSMSTSINEREQLSSRLKDIHNNGYVEMESDYAQFLFSLPKHYSKEIAEYQYADENDTHLKNSISQIKLAFSYSGISFLDKKNIIGFGAIGNWDENHKGWTGVVEFFYDKNLGICALNIFNTKLSHGVNQVAKEVARYDINSMPNVLSIEGNAKTGFLYHITFYQRDYWKELECANKTYNPKKTKQLITLAKKLDKDHGSVISIK